MQLPLGHLFGGQQIDMNSGNLKRATMVIIVNELQNRGVKVGFIMVPSDSTRPITLEQEAKIIRTPPESERTWREDLILRDFERKSFPPGATIGYGGDEVSIALPADLSNPATARETLAKVAPLDPRYELISSNGFPVICPRDDAVRNVRMTMSLTKVAAFDAVGKLGEALEKKKIDWCISGGGPTPPREIYGKNIISVNFANTPLIDSFCRFAEALGPDYTWSILGIKGDSRNFGFSQVAH